MTVEIQDDSEVPLDLKRLRTELTASLVRAGCSDRELSVLLTDDDRMAELNQTFRNKPNPTDVLSFPQDDFSGDSCGDLFVGNLLGDIAISVPTAVRQANERNVPLIQEVCDLAVHGLLHLLGRDHETEGWDVWEEALKEIVSDA